MSIEIINPGGPSLATPVALLLGGTAADLSGTGGTSFVLRQSSIGAVVTVSQLAASDLSNGVTGSGPVMLATSPQLTGSGNSPGFWINGTYTAGGTGTSYGFLSRGTLVAAANNDQLLSIASNLVTLATGTFTGLSYMGLNFDLSGLVKTGTGTIDNTWGLRIVAGTVGTNNYAATFTGKVGIGTSSPATDLDVQGVINALTGFRVAGAAATAGHVLRANGTNYVDAALAASDLSNGATGSGAVALAGSPTFTGTVSDILSQHGFTRFVANNPDTTTTDFGTQAQFALFVAGNEIGALKALAKNLTNLSTPSLFLATKGNYPIAFGLNDTATPSMVLGTSGGLYLDSGVTGGDKGAGTINVSGNYYVGGSQIAASNLSNGMTGSGALVLQGGNPTFTAGAIVDGAALIAKYNLSALPATTTQGGLATGWNATQNDAEADFLNIYPNGLGFNWYQGTSGSSYTKIMSLSGTGSLTVVGKIASYNGIATVSNGMPSIVATIDLTGQTAAIGTTTLYAVPASGAGNYEVSWNSKVTTSGTAGATLGSMVIGWTDPDGTAQTQTMSAIAMGGAGTSIINNIAANALNGLTGFTHLFNCKASTNITYSMGLTIVGTPAFNLHIRLKAM